jgi:hypothetical protein
LTQNTPGIAFLIPPYGRGGNVFQNIEVFQRWGNSRSGRGSLKAPTVLAYSKESPSLLVPPWESPILAQHVDSVSWFKLLLDKELDLDNWVHEAQGWADSRGILHLPEGMTALQVIAKYLSWLRDALWRRLEVEMSMSGGNLDTTPIQFWLTVPVSWSDTTRELMREAISNAGFGARDGDQVHLLTEPQAAITFALAESSSFSVHIISSTLSNLYGSDADSDSTLA